MQESATFDWEIASAKVANLCVGVISQIHELWIESI
jgi:hypothetical protein